MAFATSDDVAVRLGRVLTEPEIAMVDYVIEQVTGLIVDAVDRDAEWAEELDPVPAALKGLCVEKAIAIGSNPNGVASESKQLGSFQHSKTFPRSQDIGLFLDDEEIRRARSAVYGVTAKSASLRGPFDRLIDQAEFRDIDSDPDVS